MGSSVYNVRHERDVQTPSLGLAQRLPLLSLFLLFLLLLLNAAEGGPDGGGGWSTRNGGLQMALSSACWGVQWVPPRRYRLKESILEMK